MPCGGSRRRRDTTPRAAQVRHCSARVSYPTHPFRVLTNVTHSDVIPVDLLRSFGSIKASASIGACRVSFRLNRLAQPNQRANSKVSRLSMPLQGARGRAGVRRLLCAQAFIYMDGVMLPTHIQSPAGKAWQVQELEHHDDLREQNRSSIGCLAACMRRAGLGPCLSGDRGWQRGQRWLKLGHAGHGSANGIGGSAL